MRKKLRVGLAVLVVAIFFILGAMVWWTMPPKEPLYQGKPLSYWLSAYDWGPTDPLKSRPTEAEADRALRAAGTNAFPTLLRMLKEKDTTWKQRVTQWAYRHRVDTAILAKSHLQYRHPAADGHEATKAFEQLGAQSVNLAPELTRVYDLNANGYSRQFAVMAATYAAPKAKETVPLLLRAIADTNDFILRIDGAVALGKIRAPAEMAVPALIKALSDPEEPVRVETAFTLAEYGIEAKAAVPELQKMMDAELARGISKDGYHFGALGWGFCSGDANHIKTNKSFPSMVFQCDSYAAAQTALSKINGAVAKKESKKVFESSSPEPLEPR